jgi:signal transduction histidine kinase
MSLKAKFANGQKIWQTIVRSPPVSPEYRRWRDRLIRQRFWLALGLAAIYWLVQGIADFYELFIDPDRLLQELNLLDLTDWLEVIRQHFIWHKVALVSLLSFLILLWQSPWGRKHPALMLVLMPWSIAFMPEMVLGAVFGIPRSPSTIMFMAQVAIMPVHWRVHLVSQIVPLGFYFAVYPLIGLATFNGRSIYSFSYTVELILICIICEVGVYLYEQSKRSELEANRRLQLCLHSITHDLRTPVMGSLMLLESIQSSTPADRSIQISQAEMVQLIRGSDRLLNLMNALLDAQALSEAELVLNCQPIDIGTLVATVLQEFDRDLVEQNIKLINRIRADLPLVDVDPRQIGRVFYNLIKNAIVHNPPGITLWLDAVPVCHKTALPMLKAIVLDNGVGIALDRQETIFEPYTRGRETQYLPGLGLGLYICRQVVLAHAGEIGLENLDRKTAFWFTLPLSK